MKKQVISYSIAAIFVLAITFFNVHYVFGEGGGGGGSDPQCSSGGPGATSCSISVTVNGKTKKCERTCSSNKYACCYIKNGTKPKCKCKKYGNSN